jgi:hypothetical protein
MIRASRAMSTFPLASGQMEPLPVGGILLKDFGNSVDRFRWRSRQHLRDELNVESGIDSSFNFTCTRMDYY